MKALLKQVKYPGSFTRYSSGILYSSILSHWTWYSNTLNGNHFHLFFIYSSPLLPLFIISSSPILHILFISSSPFERRKNWLQTPFKPWLIHVFILVDRGGTTYLEKKCMLFFRYSARVCLVGLCFQEWCSRTN